MCRLSNKVPSTWVHPRAKSITPPRARRPTPMRTPQLKVGSNVAKRWDPEVQNYQLQLSDLPFFESPTFQRQNSLLKGIYIPSQMSQTTYSTIQETPGSPSPNAWPVRWRGVNPRSPKHWTPEILATKSAHGHAGSWQKWSSVSEIKNWRIELNYKCIPDYRSKCICLYLESRTNICILYLSLLIISTSHRQ